MYESHFGLSGPPFQLSPDPSFYFASKGHSNALAYLRFGAYQGEGFIVVTGEIGAGKTTLVRALLSELNTEKVVAAQIVSTQLEAGDLLKSILTAFGVAASGLSKAELIASLEAYLTLLATRGQRALLIVDEAQNLNLEAIEEMRMLSNFQFDQHALLQSFLVGQPELRKLLQTKSMEQLRQRVIASCHLGPLDAAETQAYIEHRLRKVGWKGSPAIEPAALEAIHAASGGVPRRINVLCNRLLLATFLAGSESIDAAMVLEVADELRSEVGEQASVERLPRAVATAATAVKLLPSAEEVIRLQRVPGPRPKWPVLLLADTASDYVKVRALCADLEKVASPWPAVLVTSRSPREAQADSPALGALSAPILEVHLNVHGEVRSADLLAQVLLRFDAQLAELAPIAVAIIGDSVSTLACALCCHQRGIPIVRLEGGLRAGANSMRAAILDRMAASILTRSTQTHHALYREGIPPERVRCVGSLLAQTLADRLGKAPAAADVLDRLGVTSFAAGRSAFGLMTVTGTQGKALAAQMDALLAQRKTASLPLVWLVDDVTANCVKSAALEARLTRNRIAVVPQADLDTHLSLLAATVVLITDASCSLAEEASVLQVPTVELAPDGRNAEEVARAVQEFQSDPPERTAVSNESQAAGVLLNWLGSTIADEAPGGKAVNGPSPH